jgi:hypothetical protein
MKMPVPALAAVMADLLRFPLVWTALVTALPLPFALIFQLPFCQPFGCQRVP